MSKKIETTDLTEEKATFEELNIAELDMVSGGSGSGYHGGRTQDNGQNGGNRAFA